MKETPYVPAAKLLRLLQLLQLLQKSRANIEQLADRFDTSTRTIYRYLDILKAVGFIVEKDLHNRYFVHDNK